MTTNYDLPEPGSDAAQRSKALSVRIRQEINNHGGRISFARFMEMALYHPEFGYYNSYDIKIGAKGDFVTAPEISPLFAQCIARQVRQIAEIFGVANILEVGAGNGRMAKDLLLELQNLGYLPQHYYIYEVSPAMRKKQVATISTECPDLLHHVVWLDEMPERIQGVIIANEVLDALPVHSFCVENGAIKERCVVWKNDEFAWEAGTPTSSEIAESALEIANHYNLDNGYESEINLNIKQFIRALTNTLERGIILLADYGYGQKEYYHPKRNHGTLTCFYQHNKYDNPLVLPGLMDITAHVDFTKVVEAAADYDCDLKGFTNQTSFLLSCGLADIVAEQEHQLTSIEKVHLHRAVKMLTMPTEMGEVVKFMGFAKKVTIPLLGFGLHDRRRDL